MAAAYTTGVVDSTYGMITANTVEATYADDTFVLNFEWTVSAGSFGVVPQVFVITEKM